MSSNSKKVSFNDSTVALSKEFCNEMGGRSAVIKKLNELVGADAWRAVDCQSSFWQNDEMTLVIAVEPGLIPGKALDLGLALGRFAVEVRADEMTLARDWARPGMSGPRLVRFWWD